MLNLINRPSAVAGLALDQQAGDYFLHESRCGEFHLHLLDAGATRRSEAEAFIAEAYKHVFNARLCAFYPSLIALHDRDHNVLGVVGSRWATGQRLFIEGYLEQDVECAIAAQAGPVCRDQVLEIGNLAIGRPELVYLFLALMGECVLSYDVQWLTFSLTTPLRRMLARSGVPLYELGPAVANMAASDGNDWGSYYAFDPRVCAVPAAQGLARFRSAYRRLHDRIHLGSAGG